MLLEVGNIVQMKERDWVRNGFRTGALFLVVMLGAVALSFSSQAPAQTTPATPAAQQAVPQAPPSAALPSPTAATPPAIPQAPPRAGLNIVVLDPAHGGTDPGARGTGGIRESEIVLDFGAQVRKALEAQGFQVIQTRQGDEDPSFDDRSAMANAQAGAVFVTLHIASTGLPGTVHVYVYSDLPATTDAGGLMPWGRAQTPFQGLSRKLGDLVQGLLAQRYKGSPSAAETAAVRQLRTIAAPAIAVEVSSVVVENRAALDQMAPGVADAIATGIAEFRPSYVVPTTTGGTP
ncbi:MAG: N-acetylmuramoyl-L-alanine amidase family protein [Candidatus Acidiferrales bacterium]